MNIRKLEKTDIPELFEIWKKFYNFPFPALNDPMYAVQKVVCNEKGKIVLAGIIKITSEGIFITNKDVDVFERIKAINLANDKLAEDAIRFGFEECHVFAENDARFINILRKLGFKECSGVPMVRLKNG